MISQGHWYKEKKNSKTPRYSKDDFSIIIKNNSFHLVIKVSAKPKCTFFVAGHPPYRVQSNVHRITKKIVTEQKRRRKQLTRRRRGVGVSYEGAAGGGGERGRVRNKDVQYFNIAVNNPFFFYTLLGHCHVYISVYSVYQCIQCIVYESKCNIFLWSNQNIVIRRDWSRREILQT